MDVVRPAFSIPNKLFSRLLDDASRLSLSPREEEPLSVLFPPARRLSLPLPTGCLLVLSLLPALALLSASLLPNFGGRLLSVSQLPLPGPAFDLGCGSGGGPFEEELSFGLRLDMLGLLLLVPPALRPGTLLKQTQSLKYRNERS